MAKRDERVPGTNYTGEECLLHVYWTGRDAGGQGSDHLTMRGRVSADLGIDRIPDPPFTNEEMQIIMFAAKMAAAKVLRDRKKSVRATKAHVMSKPSRRGTCPVCRRDRAVRSPKGGGGVVVGFHHGPSTFDAARCPGVGKKPLPLRLAVDDEVAQRVRALRGA